MVPPVIVQWKGWGVSVGLLFVFWVFAGIVFAVATMPYIPDKHQAAMTIQLGIAAFFLLYALSVFAVAEYRRRKPVARVENSPVPESGSLLDTDEFIFIRLEFWPLILFAIAAFLAGATWLGLDVFK